MQHVTMRIDEFDFDGWNEAHGQSEGSIAIGWIYRSFGGTAQVGDQVKVIWIDDAPEEFNINANTIRVFQAAERMAHARSVDLLRLEPNKEAAEIWNRAMLEQLN